MKATIKHCLINLESAAILCSVILGIGAAEASKWWLALALILGPTLYCKVVRFSKHLDFQEAYNRAYRLRNCR